MKAFLKTKAGVILVGFSVLAVWMLIAAQPGVAHERGTRLPSLSCSGIPEDAFFDDEENIVSGSPSGTVETKRGEGVPGRGSRTYHYAKITLPELTAGELRVFDGETTPISDAVLCRGSSPVVSSRMSYSAHDSALSAAAAATTAYEAATAAAGYHLNPDGDDLTSDAIDLTDVANLSAARSALSRARSALNTARSALSTARTALNRYPGTTTAASAALDAEAAALTAYNNSTPPSTSLENTAELTAVREALTGADGAVPGLTAAATALAGATGDTDDDGYGDGGAAAALFAAAGREHTGFEIRTAIAPGDNDYVVVVALENTGTPPSAPTATQTLNVAFHGAIATTATTSIDGSLSANDQHSYDLTITAPGLLTAETTGSTDTMGTLDGPDTDADTDSDPDEIAMVESGGSGGNFKIIAPVNTGAHTLYVEGQTSQTTGDYSLDMDFKVAMEHNPDITGITNLTAVDGPDWDTVGLLDDGTDATDRPELDSTSDEDYFLFTIAADQQGFLTVQTVNDLMTAAASDANTTGTLYGPMGEIATDSDSGAGNHFRISAPVKTGTYIVEVTGSVGGYLLEFTFPSATVANVRDIEGMTTGTPTCTDNPPYEICAATGTAQEVDQYTLDIPESGALYVHTEGSIDTVGTLYGPDGSTIAEDDNSGADDNFRIAMNVTPGLHLLQVRGKTRSTAGVYQLVTSFVTGAEVEEPTTPPTTTPPPDAPEADATGTLEEPPDGGTRGGIGLVRGWACQDAGAGVEIRVTGPSGPDSETDSFTAPYGSERDDVEDAEACDRRGNDFGFAVQFNYNNLPAGTYEIEAWIGREQVGQTNTFTVARIPGDGFLERDPPNGRVLVEDFPRRGVTTILQWDRSSQNFEIQGTQ